MNTDKGVKLFSWRWKKTTRFYPLFPYKSLYYLLFGEMDWFTGRRPWMLTFLIRVYPWKSVYYYFLGHGWTPRLNSLCSSLAWIERGRPMDTDTAKSQSAIAEIKNKNSLSAVSVEIRVLLFGDTDERGWTRIQQSFVSYAEKKLRFDPLFPCKSVSYSIMLGTDKINCEFWVLNFKLLNDFYTLIQNSV